MPKYATPTDATADQPATAQIIPFPIRPDQRPDANQARDRLARALASLDAALAEQRAAMTGWRDSLNQLRKATSGLGLSMQRYDRTLGKLGGEVSELHAEALRLERWADDTVARTRSGTDVDPR